MADTANINDFLQRIKTESDKERVQTEAEIASYRYSELSKARKKYAADADRYKKRGIAKGKNELSAEISKRHIDARVDLINRRAEITDSIIDAAKELLVEFAHSDGYKALLLQSAAELSSHLLSNRVTLYVRAQDMIYEKELIKAYGSYCKIDVDTSILIGGIRGYDKILQKIVDDTLDEKLSEQREWFTQNSKLTISIR